MKQCLRHLCRSHSRVNMADLDNSRMDMVEAVALLKASLHETSTAHSRVRMSVDRIFHIPPY